MSQAESEFDRRLGNCVRIGTIAELNEAHADGPRATVELGDGEGELTDWLPWITLRAGEDKTWWAPEPGEQVIVLAPSGELSNGVILPGINCDAFPANGDSRDVFRVTFKDETVVEYNRETHAMAVAIVDTAGSLAISVGASSLEMDNDHIRLAIGGSYIELTSSGVTINGTRIDLNS